jgi:hypothetical protein
MFPFVLRSFKEEGRYLLKSLLFATLAKKVYRFRAIDSPAKDAARFFSVCEPARDWDIVSEVTFTKDLKKLNH